MKLAVGRYNIKRAVGTDGVERFWNQQVNVTIMRLEGGEAVGVVSGVKGGAQRVVVLRNLTESGELAFAARGGEFFLRMGAEGMQAGVNVGTQNIGKLGIAPNVYQKDDEHQREKSAAQLQKQASAPPATAFLIVENGLAFVHESIQAKRLQQGAYVQLHRFAMHTTKSFLTAPE